MIDPPITTLGSEGSDVGPLKLSPGTIHIVREPVSYPLAWGLQSRLHQERVLDRRADTVLILEHQPVYTLGRSTQHAHWGGNESALRAGGAEVYRVNRGGSVTYHAPGQIVAYPIVRMVRHAAGPRQLVRLLEEVVIRVLKRWNIDGYRIDKKPGVWVDKPEPAKISSIGVRIEKGVILHGFALNAHMDLTPFQRIQPCGLQHCAVTSMAACLNSTISVQAVKQDVAEVFCAIFTLDWETVEERMGPGGRIIDDSVCLSTSIM